MQNQTIRQLNQLNRDFYRTTAEAFDDSRQYFWSGWEEFLPAIKQHYDEQHFSILDIGCGNGRFAQFLSQNFKTFTYTGWDFSSELINFAQIKNDSTEFKFLEIDLVEALLVDSMPSDSTYDLITLFGVMHHIPSFTLRQKLFQKLASLINQTGLIIVTSWQFTEDQRLMQRQIDPSVVEIDQAELEPNDYFLDWQRQTSAIRYCHLITPEEMENLITSANLKVVSQFSADGSNEKMNEYYLLKRK